MILPVLRTASIFAVLFIPNVKAEVFTSMAEMEPLVLLEKHILASLKSYMNAEEERLASLRTFMSRVDDALRYVNETDISKYLGNPVNAYLMLKRFNVDWKNLQNMFTSDNAGGMYDFFTIFCDL